MYQAECDNNTTPGSLPVAGGLHPLTAAGRPKTKAGSIPSGLSAWCPVCWACRQLVAATALPVLQAARRCVSTQQPVAPKVCIAFSCFLKQSASLAGNAALNWVQHNTCGWPS